ncbi:DUF1003 domain-containing protein [Paramicrobacterium agarici]|uniref:Putative membrane protein n=1 Tax=Paramicrobacterium agarici TaxID=630514 RepID=A0A2A9DZ55_9MICO|nr:DUF1003 domain-containing protein [Microbacterium agarici]PFG31656.1 putative membrane protein [Microbacterium agarici]TQO21560.1 putative membrane protein [Microbacterium agarici]
MARSPRDDKRLDAPRGVRQPLFSRKVSDRDRFGRFTEWVARAMGTPAFLLSLTVFCLAWMAWNTWGPESVRFDSVALGFTALTLVLSLQASYAAPLILLAQNRQDDRDRVQIEQDRQRSERNLADTEYLAREVVALRLAMRDMASKDFIRQELRALLDELDEKMETTESDDSRDA